MRHSAMARAALILAVVLVAAGLCPAGDWPMWRHDAARTAVTDEKLPPELHLQWVVEYPPQEPAWPQQTVRGYMTFDVSYKPVVLGKRMFVGSAAEHCLKALDTDSGKEVWRFYADGPIRFAAVCAKDKVYFVSDDGWLYCLKAADGTLVWKFSGGPDNRKIIGNGHLVGLWPARGGPVLADGPSTGSGQATIYFAASIWPFMGAFLHAVDAETGKAVWTNSGTGAQWKAAYSLQGSGLLVRPGMYGSTPQGYLLVADNRLAVPQGRNVAQLFDRKTGDLLWHEIYGMHVQHNPRDYWFALKAGRSVFSGSMGSRGVDIDTARMSYPNPVGYGITGEKALYVVSGRGISTRAMTAGYKPLWNFALTSPAAPTCPGSYIKAGDNLYIPGAAGNILIVKDADTDKRSLVVGPKVPGKQVWDMLAADGKLFVVTRDGKIACYGGKKVEPATHKMPAPKPLAVDAAARAEVDEILNAAKPPAGGWCLLLHVKAGALAKAFSAQSKMNVIVVEEDAGKVDALRREASAAGVYGKAFSVHAGEPLSYGLPPYLADIIVSERRDAAALVKSPEKIARLYRMLRPYTGTLVVPRGEARLDDIKAAVAKAKLNGPVEVTAAGKLVLVKRMGPPAGAADWSHNNANAANTLANFDKLVKPPLGLLWFGGPTNAKILPRHGRGPSPAVAAGRVFIEGPNLIRALDVYTGRMLWEREFPAIGSFYDTGSKQLGTHETGPNYCASAEAVYVITPAKCLALDAATGKTLREFALPDGVEKDSKWATVRVDGDLLIATIRPIDVKRGFKVNAKQGAGGRWLAVYNRSTGKNLWARKAAQVFRSNGVAVADGKVFCLDALEAGELAAAQKAGATVADRPTIVCFDAAGGKQLWKTDQDVFGTWLGYSAEHKVLVQAGCGGGRGEPTAMAAHKAADGSQMWRQPAAGQKDAFTGPPVLHHDIILPQHGQVVGLVDGKLRTRPEPMTAKPVPWRSDAHGCGFLHAGEYMTFHRAWSTGGYTPLRGAPRMVGLGGFRSGCTANMIPAGGVVAVPDYTRDCECQFKNKTSLGLIHMPDASAWTVELGPPPVAGRVKRLGLNFGGPADRMSDEGTLWLDCPDVGGPSPQVTVALTPGKLVPQRNWIGQPHWRRGLVKKPGFAGRTFRAHRSTMTGGPLPWVTGSGLAGITSVNVGLFYPAGATETATYTVRLYFAEPDTDAKPGSRVFSVKLQEQDALKDFDLVKEAGGPLRGIVKEFKNIKAADSLFVQFVPKTGNPLICGLEVISK